MKLRFLYKLIAFFMGCLLCFFLHTALGWSAVLASACVGLVGSLLPVNTNLRAAIYSGSFAGMCSSELVSNYWEIFGISLIGASIYLYSLSLFKGFGGKLGTVAFVSVAIFYLIKGSLI